jgi:UDP-4-amino-4,6-dideoxy-N-acetyl-beta-L-altrosamine N-acetyltransferase
MNSLGQLRSIQDSELGIMLSWRNAPAVRANMYTRHEISEEEHLTWWSRTKQRPDQLYFMYENRNQLLGIVGLTAIDIVNNNCSWAFYASPDAPRGTGSRMEYLAIEYVFGVLKLHKLYCEVLAFNSPVIKLHHKFGFVVEGIFRQHHHVGNEYTEIHRLGLLHSEWINKRAEMLNKLIYIHKY